MTIGKHVKERCWHTQTPRPSGVATLGGVQMENPLWLSLCSCHATEQQNFLYSVFSWAKENMNSFLNIGCVKDTFIYVLKKNKTEEGKEYLESYTHRQNYALPHCCAHNIPQSCHSKIFDGTVSRCLYFMKLFKKKRRNYNFIDSLSLSRIWL